MEPLLGQKRIKRWIKLFFIFYCYEYCCCISIDSNSTVLSSVDWANQIIDLYCILIDFFLYDGNIASCQRVFIKSNHPRCSIKKGVLESLAKFTGKYLCRSLFFNKVACLRSGNLSKKRLLCSSVNFAKFLRTPFLQNTSGRLLLSHHKWVNGWLVIIKQFLKQFNKFSFFFFLF